MHYVQRSLFPDAGDFLSDAVAELERLNALGALRILAQGRALEPGDLLLADHEAAARFLADVLRPGDESLEDVASVLQLVEPGLAEGRLGAESASIVDRILAGYALQRRPADALYLDSSRSVPFALLELIRGRPDLAIERLWQCLRAGDRLRADLWGYYGDAHRLARDEETANEAHARALVLEAIGAPSTRRLDWLRLRHGALKELRAELAADLGEARAAGALLCLAWARGVLPLRRGATWMGELRAELLACGLEPRDSHHTSVERRFGWLLFEELSLPEGAADLDRRLEMRELCPELFAAFQERLRAEPA